MIAFVTAGDPNLDVCREILSGLPASGADMIEIGMPFSDPMADGPTIQDSSRRALKAGGSMGSTLRLVRDFRGDDQSTPVVLMGYFNPIYSYGIDAFIADAIEAGADGLIVVDMPPEEEAELAIPALEKGLDFIYLSTPTTDEARLERILAHASGFPPCLDSRRHRRQSANLSEVQAAKGNGIAHRHRFRDQDMDDAREMASVATPPSLAPRLSPWSRTTSTKTATRRKLARKPFWTSWPSWRGAWPKASDKERPKRELA